MKSRWISPHPVASEIDGKTVRVVQANEIGDGTFIGKCAVDRRTIDDQIRVKVRMPEGTPRPEAYRYWKFIWWVELTPDDLDSIRRKTNSDDYDFEVLRRDFGR